LIIDCPHHALALRVLHSNSFTNVRGNGSNAALTWKMIPKEGYVIYGRGDFHGSRVALGDRLQAAEIMRKAARIVTIKTNSFLSISTRLLLRSTLHRSAYFGAVLVRGIPLVTAAISQ
jgi:hypothetical protein